MAQDFHRGLHPTNQRREMAYDRPTWLGTSREARQARRMMDRDAARDYRRNREPDRARRRTWQDVKAESDRNAGSDRIPGEGQSAYFDRKGQEFQSRFTNPKDKGISPSQGKDPVYDATMAELQRRMSVERATEDFRSMQGKGPLKPEYQHPAEAPPVVDNPATGGQANVPSTNIESAAQTPPSPPAAQRARQVAPDAVAQAPGSNPVSGQPNQGTIQFTLPSGRNVEVKPGESVRDAIDRDAVPPETDDEPQTAAESKPKETPATKEDPDEEKAEMLNQGVLANTARWGAPSRQPAQPSPQYQSPANSAEKALSQILPMARALGILAENKTYSFVEHMRNRNRLRLSGPPQQQLSMIRAEAMKRIDALKKKEDALPPNATLGAQRIRAEIEQWESLIKEIEESVRNNRS